MKKHFVEKVLSNEQIAFNTYLLRFTCDDEMLRLFRPGQFAHVKIPCAGEMLLRRPISINCADFRKKEVHLAYNPVGKGTRLLTAVKPGDLLDVLMPLGNGFRIMPDMKKIWLVGGGIGCAPLQSMFDKYQDKEYKAFLGFRSKDSVYQVEDFKLYADVYVSTDDGTCGEHAFCTQVLEKALEHDKPDVILACGPGPFFRSLAAVVGDIPTQVSLEQRMGCGTGMCATCVCKVGGEHRRVCVEGPVFDIKEVDALNG